MLAINVLLSLAALPIVVLLGRSVGKRLRPLVQVALSASALLFTVAVLAAPAPYQPPLEPLTDTEKTALTQLHSSAVVIFVARPDFGVRRMDGIRFGPNRDVPLPPNAVVQDPRKAFPKPEEAHSTLQATLAKGGVSRLPSDNKNEQWRLRKVLLVGLVKNPEAVVYLTDKMPKMKDVKDVKKRKLDNFEQAALATVKETSTLKIEKRGKELRMMGPIFAGASCVKCHDKKGQLLGAFAYEFERVPMEEPVEKK